MANANRSNLTVLRARARNMPYIPAASLTNTLLDPAKLFLVIPAGVTWTAGPAGVLRPQVLRGAFAGGVAGLYEMPPAQSPSGLVTERGTANATPGWIDGFAAVPQYLNNLNSAADSASIALKIQDALTFARIVWKGDEQILRTMYLGDMQRIETAYAAANLPAGADLQSFGNTQAACGAPGQPVNRTPGYVWTGRSAAEWYVELTGSSIVNGTAFNVVIVLYVYGQFILNVDPLQAGTANLIRGGTFGASAGSCDDNAIGAMEGPAPGARMSPVGGTKSTIRCG